MSKYCVKIDGMSCNHCVMSVTKALDALDNVKSVDVKLDEGCAYVEGRDENAGDAELAFMGLMKQAIDDIGFEVKSVEVK